MPPMRLLPQQVHLARRSLGLDQADEIQVGNIYSSYIFAWCPSAKGAREWHRFDEHYSFTNHWSYAFKFERRG
jgi:hypothetical protein